MPKTEFLTDLVFNMDNKDFELLQEVIAARNNKERYPSLEVNTINL